MRKLLFAAFFVFAVGNLYALEDPAVKTLNISFADLERSKDILSSKDKYIAALTPFDRSARLKTFEDVSEKEFLQFLSENALSWTADEKKTIETITNSIKSKISKFNLTFPGEILLIKTTGQEELGGSYTRENAVVISEKITNSSEDEIEQLVADSLLHIFLRYNPKVRDRLCAIIGFLSCEEIKMPDGLDFSRITDPDAYSNSRYIGVSYKDSVVQVVPVIVRGKVWACGKDRQMCFSLEPKLMVIEKDEKTWKARLVDSEPIILDFSEVSGFYEKVGRNSKSIWHPEEIVVDNLMMLIDDSNDVATPRIVAEMEKVLKE